MTFVLSMIRTVCSLGILLALAFASHAQQEQSPARQNGEDISSLRQSIEHQSHQIEALTQQIARLTQIIEGAHATPSTVSAPETLPEPAPAAVEVPKAEAVDAGAKHVVAKGETLTSIAKHYKINVGELLKVNKITDDRKLQIGQSLIIPPPKNPEPTPTPKENP